MVERQVPHVLEKRVFEWCKTSVDGEMKDTDVVEDPKGFFVQLSADQDDICGCQIDTC